MGNRVKLTKAVIDRLDHEKDGQWVTDTEVPELLVRLTPIAKTFVARWTSKIDGKRKQEKIEKVGTISVAEARDRARKLVADDNFSTVETLADVFKVWNEHYSSLIGERHANDMRSAWVKHIGPDLGKTKLSRLSNATLQEWYNKKLHEHPLTPSGNSRAKPYSPDTVRRWVSYVSKLCTIARKRGDMIANPVETVEMKARTVRVAVFTREDMKILADQIKVAQDDYPVGVALLRFLMIFPCRGEEAREMEWADLDLDAGTWTIPAERYKTRQDKVFPLGPLQIDLLRSLPRWSDKYVFPRPSAYGIGKTRKPLNKPADELPVTKNHQILVWKKVRPKPLGAHTLRKTMGTLYLNDGMPLEVVSKFLGHSNTQTTQRAYAHLSPSTAAKYLAMWSGIVEDDEPQMDGDDEMPAILRFQAALSDAGRR